jgi:hypothetical protein
VETVPMDLIARNQISKEKKKRDHVTLVDVMKRFFFFLKYHFGFRWSLKEDEEFVLF